MTRTNSCGSWALSRLLPVLLLIFILFSTCTAQVVISQVYGGGGNSGAKYKNDFIELFNLGSQAVDLSTWSVQYASSTGTSWSKTNLSGTVQPGHYYLIQEAAGSAGTVNLPTPDAIGSLAMGATAGKVALVASQTSLSGSCPTAADFVGFGTANCFEGTGPTAALSNTTAAFRNASGCIDTNNNNADFSTGPPLPRNSTNLNTCAASTNPTITSALSTPTTVEIGGMVTLTVMVTPGTNPTSTGIAVMADLSGVGGSATQNFYDDGTNGDAIANDGVFTFATVANGVAGPYNLPVAVTDSQTRTASGNISLTLNAPAPYYAIHDIQGNTDASPLNGKPVKTSGIVTAVVNNGCFVEAADDQQDADPLTSEGLFIYSGTKPAVTAGDAVTVSGTVSEYQPSGSPLSTTELITPSFTISSHSQSLPTTVNILPSPSGAIDQLERYEGMLVHVANPVVTGPTGISGTASNGVFYVVSGTTRPLREPGLAPGAATIAGMPSGVPLFDGNPERLRVDSSQLGTGASVSNFDVISDLSGPLTYSNGDFTIFPTSFTNVSTAAVTPLVQRGDNEFTVGSFNMLNFTSDSNRLAKASLAIRNVLHMPDVLGVEEVDNATTLQALADRINSEASAAGQGTPGYVGVMLAPAATQNVGFLYRGDRLQDVTITEIGRDATFTDPRNGSQATLNDRPPLVMTAKLLPPLGLPLPVTVIVNHLRSLIDVDTASGTGDFARAKRQKGAEFLANLISQHQTAGEQVISVGDYNAYEFNDGYVDVLGTVKGSPTPATQVLLASPDLVDPDLADLVTTLPADKRYTYVENGNRQTLDHIVVTSGLLARPYHLEIAHNDADFAQTLSLDATRPERVSDHDVPVAYFSFPSTATIPAPTITPNFGAFTTPQPITISHPWLGVTIYYTTDGTPPTTNSLLYSGPFTIQGSTTVKAIATSGTQTPSAVTAAVFNFLAASPIMSPGFGTFASAQSIALSDSTPGVTIYYTTDGTTPTAASAVYTAPIAISKPTTIKAMAAGNGYAPSQVTSGIFQFGATKPVISPGLGTFTSPQSITLTDGTPGVTIYYTTDGSIPTTNSTVYTAPFIVSSSSTIQAIAAGNGYAASPTATALFKFAAAKPSISPGFGTFTSAQSIKLTDSTPGVTIYYTTDGSTPTTNSTVYTAPFTVSTSSTIQAIAAGNGYVASPTATALLQFAAAKPNIYPGFGTFTSPQSITLTDSTPGVTIYYTTDGSTPTTNSTVYTGPFTISTSSTIQAIAAGNGYPPTAVSSAILRIVAATPTLSPGFGTFTSPQSVTIADITPGVTIYYTTDGSVPTTASSIYTGPIPLSKSTNIQAIAAGNGYAISNVASGIYTFK